MPQIGEVFRWQTVAGRPVILHNCTITPLTQVLALHWPQGGFVWNRPVALLIEQDGQVERVPVVDMTRLVQLALFGCAIFVLLATFWWPRFNKGKQDERTNEWSRYIFGQ
jgi:hypothetical protein